MKSRFINVKRPHRGTERQCQHCGRSAVVVATRVDKFDDGKQFRMSVRYCDEHAALRGAAR